MFLNSFIKLIIIFTATSLLLGCKADSLEIKLSDKDIQSAIAGKAVAIDFEAEFSMLGELDDENKATLDQLLVLAEEFLSLDDFEIAKGDFGAKVLLEGSIPLTANPGEESPWYVSVSPYDSEFYIVQLKTGTKFDRLESAMSDINFLLSADPFHPVKYKFKAPGSTVIAPAVEIGGIIHLYYSEKIENRLTMNFSGGPFDSTGGGFLVKFK
ncbi:MAG: hypothetical protein O3A56_05715 [Proteobacteria bacterium]|nr:hypothetical protein [Pseudomonadota bacterium]MDA0862756.1 hypothetical protein [Pseudomonadota bacterium]MDA1030934.1 hypothetical protein [Pseudomonadota bacterium]